MIHSVLRAPLGAATLALALVAGPAWATPAILLGGMPWLDGPGNQYASLGDLTEGTHLDVIWCGTTEHWCLVQWHGKKGWVPLTSLNIRPGGGGQLDGSVASSCGNGGGSSGGDGAPGGGGGGGGGAAIATEAAPLGGSNDGGGGGPFTKGPVFTYTGH